MRTNRFLAIVHFALGAALGSACMQPTMASGDGAADDGGSNAACIGEGCVARGACLPGQASAQFRRQEAPPPRMAVGARARVSVTFDNCSGQRWSARDFALMPQPTGTESVWGAHSIALPADVPDGAEVTIPFEISAPASAGQYDFSWAVVHQGVEVFQQHSPAVPVTVVAPADCSRPGPPARFRSQIAPAAFVATGEHVRGSVTFANCSTDVWSRAMGFRLGSQADADNTTWGTSRIELPADVPTESEVTIPIDVVAPAHPGTYRYAWEIVHEGVRWYDESSPVVEITALEPADCSPGAPPARFVSQHAPGSVDPNQTLDVSATFANCSGTTWDARYRLQSADANGDATWSVVPVALPFAVGPGFAVEIPFRVRAPGQPGNYGYRWAIRPEGGAALDEATPPLDVTVRCIPSCGNHDCGGDGCGGSCGTCTNFATCDGAHCQAPMVSCGDIQWWNTPLTYFHVVGGWNDTDLAVRSSTPVQLRHASRLDHYGVYGWGYMPEFTDLVTGDRFRLLHLRPQRMLATNIGQVYPAGFVVGLSGGDTADTGLGVYSTGAHLCVQTLVAYRSAFPTGNDPCR